MNKVNHLPVAVNDTVNTNENTPVTFNVLANDYEINGTLNNPVIITNPNHGVVVVNGNGTISYTPAPNYFGNDTIYYRVCDNSTPVKCDSAYAFINVININNAPIAGNTTYYILNNVVLNSSVKNLVTDLDNNIDTSSFVIISNPAKGTLVMKPNGSFTYTPLYSYNGKVSFIYQVCDKGTPSLCDTGLIEIVIIAVNKAPLALNDSVDVQENHEIVIDVRANDIDSDGVLNIPVIVVQPANGIVVVNVDGTISYTPNNNYVGIDEFKYSVSDNGIPQLSDSAIVKIHITRLPDDMVKIPQGFSPNNDGVNDKFVINNIDKYPNNKLTVVNRWGEVVYEKQFYKNDWGGDANKGILTMQGTLPSGTYFYIFETGTEDAPFTGYIYITK